MFSGKSMAIALLLPEKCDCLKLWFGKPVNCKISAFLLLLLFHQVIVLNFSRLKMLTVGFTHVSGMVLNIYDVLERET